MRPDNADEFAGSDDSGFLPELWEMALVAGDQIVRAGGIGAFEENLTVEALSFDAFCLTTSSLCPPSSR